MQSETSCYFIYQNKFRCNSGNGGKVEFVITCISTAEFMGIVVRN